MKASTEHLPETHESLWRLIVSPTIWAVHFLACYVTGAVYCAKFAGGTLASLAVVRLAFGVYTLLAVAGIVWNGRRGWRAYRRGSAPLPLDEDTPEDRHRFLGFATLLLAGLSLVATLFSAMVALFFEDCR